MAAEELSDDCFPAERKMCFRSVVLPAPRKPESTVTGKRVKGRLSPVSFIFREKVMVGGGGGGGGGRQIVHCSGVVYNTIRIIIALLLNSIYDPFSFIIFYIFFPKFINLENLQKKHFFLVDEWWADGGWRDDGA